MEVASVHTEVGALSQVVLKHARDAFLNDATIRAQWKALNFTAEPDLGRAIGEYEQFADLVAASGASITWLPANGVTSLDSIYVRDAALWCARGAILCRMGKAARAGEPEAMGLALEATGVPIAGAIVPPGRIEGGDVIWLDSRTVAIGVGYRTTMDGIGQFQAIVGSSVEVIPVPLPHWRGESDVMHLMSLVSPVDRDLAVVYSRLLTVPFRQWLHDRGIHFVEVPEDEFESMGTNVLALAPRRCLILAGNPRTRRALEQAGADVVEYQGTEISLKGGGGPTCLTRPLARGAAW